MFSSFLKTHEISFAQNVNMWIYYIRKVPLIGKKIPESLYNTTNIKVIISNILRVFTFILGFLKKYIYMFLMVLLPALFISEKTSIDPIYIKFHIFFFLSFITGPLVDNKFTSNISKDFYMINLMRINAKDYYLSRILFSYIEYFIYFIFPIMLLGCTLAQSFIVTLEFVSFRIITQALHLLFSAFKGTQLSNKWYFVTPIMLIPFAIAYGSHFIGFTFNAKKLLFNIPFIIIVLILSIISLFYLINYKQYTILARSIISKDDLDKISSISSEAMFMDVKLDEKKLATADLKNDKYKDKHGLGYLNSKFIERHNRIIINPIKRRVLIILLICIGVSLVTICSPASHKSINLIISSSSGFLVFILYGMSLGEKITKAFFFNCDNSLLRYKFYKEPKVILSNFKSRLKITVFLNLIPAICLALGLGIITILSKGNLLRFLPIFISILTLSCFFSVHYLFLYYIAQPYTAQLTIKSPIYKTATFIVWLLAYTCLQVRSVSIWFTLLVILVTILYTLISLILVYKFAPKNFRLK